MWDILTILCAILGGISGWYDPYDYWGGLHPIIPALAQGLVGGWAVGWLMSDVASREKTSVVVLFYGALIIDACLLVLTYLNHFSVGKIFLFTYYGLAGSLSAIIYPRICFYGFLIGVISVIAAYFLHELKLNSEGFEIAFQTILGFSLFIPFIAVFNDKFQNLRKKKLEPLKESKFQK